MTGPAEGPARPDAPPRTWLTVAGVVVVAFNMRIAIAATGPLVPDIRLDLGLSRGTVSLLTTLPVLCFGVLATAAVALGRRIGSERALLLTMLGVAAGSAVRYLPGTPWLLLGTAVIGTAVAATNVLLPTVVKQHFERSSSVITGVYTAALVTGAACASGVSAPLADDAGLGWQGTLLVMGVPALLAAVVWAPQVRRVHRPPETARSRVLRSPVTWGLAAFMGTQSLLFYAMLAWLPTLLRDAGVPATHAGGALALFNLIGVPSSLLVPTLAARRPSQVPAVLAICLAWVIALTGLLVAPAYYVLWAVFAGLAQGAGISLALTLIVLRASTPGVARTLSGTVQGIGYLAAAAGPFVMGALRDATTGWGAPIVSLGVVVAVMAASAPWSAGSRQVE